MTDSDNVAIFWDYENCHAASYISGYEVANSIRRVAHKYGSVQLFKAYLQLSEASLTPKAANLRSELQASGVSLTDCPHSGKKNVADMMILVDMMAWAIDNPSPATIILITGDRDFTYAVSVLRLRRFRVIVISPAGTGGHPSLKLQASAYFDFNVEAMGKAIADTAAPGMRKAEPAAAATPEKPASPTPPLVGLPSSLMQHKSKPSVDDVDLGYEFLERHSRAALAQFNFGVSKPAAPLLPDAACVARDMVGLPVGLQQKSLCTFQPAARKPDVPPVYTSVPPTGAPQPMPPSMYMPTLSPMATPFLADKNRPLLPPAADPAMNTPNFCSAVQAAPAVIPHSGSPSVSSEPLTRSLSPASATRCRVQEPGFLQHPRSIVGRAEPSDISDGEDSTSTIYMSARSSVLAEEEILVSSPSVLATPLGASPAPDASLSRTTPNTANVTSCEAVVPDAECEPPTPGSATSMFSSTSTVTSMMTEKPAKTNTKSSSNGVAKSPTKNRGKAAQGSARTGRSSEAKKARAHKAEAQKTRHAARRDGDVLLGKTNMKEWINSHPDWSTMSIRL